MQMLTFWASSIDCRTMASLVLGKGCAIVLLMFSTEGQALRTNSRLVLLLTGPAHSSSTQTGMSQPSPLCIGVRAMPALLHTAASVPSVVGSFWPNRTGWLGLDPTPVAANIVLKFPRLVFLVVQGRWIYATIRVLVTSNFTLQPSWGKTQVH